MLLWAWLLASVALVTCWWAKERLDRSRHLRSRVLGGRYNLPRHRRGSA